ncbi:hypothetical protein [Acinetobacter baumannii]|uniref:hypothetical protein n=1 Tax=Acinetobacter baumannii TaxID=470 RepID=UPI00031804A6|nr:hypothetical protein [Acinetobacter baumannii]
MKFRDKLEVVILSIETIEPLNKELYDLKYAMEDTKEIINSNLVRTLRAGLRKI